MGYKIVRAMFFVIPFGRCQRKIVLPPGRRKVTHPHVRRKHEVDICLCLCCVTSVKAKKIHGKCESAWPDIRVPKQDVGEKRSDEYGKHITKGLVRGSFFAVARAGMSRYKLYAHLRQAHRRVFKDSDKWNGTNGMARPSHVLRLDAFIRQPSTRMYSAIQHRPRSCARSHQSHS